MKQLHAFPGLGSVFVWSTGRLAVAEEPLADLPWGGSEGNMSIKQRKPSVHLAVSLYDNILSLYDNIPAALLLLEQVKALSCLQFELQTLEFPDVSLQAVITCLLISSCRSYPQGLLYDEATEWLKSSRGRKLFQFYDVLWSRQEAEKSLNYFYPIPYTKPIANSNFKRKKKPSEKRKNTNSQWNWKIKSLQKPQGSQNSSLTANPMQVA